VAPTRRAVSSGKVFRVALFGPLRSRYLDRDLSLSFEQHTLEMGSLPLCFIVTEPSSISKADQQRRRSKALSHAAIVSYARRNPKFSGWVHVQADEPAASSFQLPVPSKGGARRGTPKAGLGPRVHAVATTDAPSPSDFQRSLEAISPHNPLCEQLDPFLKTACWLTLRERNALHQCRASKLESRSIITNCKLDLLATPVRIYGTRPGSLYCPVRDMNVPQIQLNPLWLQWTLLFAEHSTMPAGPHRSTAVLARRAQIYTYMNELVSNSETRFSDATITGLAFGSLIEWQVGSLDVARQHLGFVRHTLLAGRSGAQPLPTFTALCTYTKILWVGLGSQAFRSSQSLSLAIGRFTRTFRAMQEDAKNISTEDGESYTTPQEAHRPLSGATSHIYRRLRSRLFDPGTVLHGFLVPLPQEDVVYASHQLTLLWLINSILHQLRDDPDQEAEFLRTLHNYLESHDNPSPFTSAKRRTGTHIAGQGLKHFTLTGMVVHIASLLSLPELGCMQEQNCGMSGILWDNVDMGKCPAHSSQ
jgi:hypothetical protein